MIDSIKNHVCSTGKRLLFSVISGSRAYGLSDASSDLDIRFVYSNPLDYYVGFDSTNKDSMPIGGNDVFGYELKKFVSLCVANNPSALETLFSDPSDFLYLDQVFQEKLLAVKLSFLSRRVFNTFTSYAKGQVDRAKRCTRDVVERLVFLESLLEINSVDPSATIISRNRLLPVAGSDEFLSIGSLVDTYREFKQNKFPYSDLGSKRKHNIMNYGYDTKNTAHAVRLALACKTLLLFPESYTPKITNPETVGLLLDIKNGRYTITEVEAMMQDILLETRDAYNKSSLPEEASLHMFSSLVKEVILHGNVV